MGPEDRSSIEQFVRRTLGCRCPDEVFESLRIARIQPCPGASTITRLVAGDRLLVYVVGAGDRDPIDVPIEDLAAAGRADRDRHGLNRFRLAVASRRHLEAATSTLERFVLATNGDERAHLHFVAQDEIPGALGPDIAAG